VLSKVLLDATVFAITPHHTGNSRADPERGDPL
jgi:hypothetical protein